MTENEIIKALECCSKPVIEECCSECPYHLGGQENCHKLLGDILDLINRQRAEIEKLKIENRILSQKRANIFEILTAFERGEEKGRLDAVKEFVERLCKDRVSNDPVVIEVKAELKEMVGETK